MTVWNFVIKERYRRKKIGTLMFDYMINYAKNSKCDFVNFIAEKNNIGAQSFYKKFALNKEVAFVKLIDKEIW